MRQSFQSRFSPAEQRTRKSLLIPRFRALWGNVSEAVIKAAAGMAAAGLNPGESYSPALLGYPDAPETIENRDGVHGVVCSHDGGVFHVLDKDLEQMRRDIGGEFNSMIPESRAEVLAVVVERGLDPEFLGLVPAVSETAVC